MRLTRPLLTQATNRIETTKLLLSLSRPRRSEVEAPKNTGDTMHDPLPIKEGLLTMLINHSSVIIPRLLLRIQTCASADLVVNEQRQDLLSSSPGVYEVLIP
jgi:hypothetical protein